MSGGDVKNESEKFTNISNADFDINIQNQNPSSSHGSNNNVDNRQFVDKRTCFKCGNVGHIAMNCP